jgi:threonine dehydrogenase-like Zn-dependent dehydrogenase
LSVPAHAKRRAITVQPNRVNSARLDRVGPADEHEGALLVAIKAIGICGTDREILSGKYGTAPNGHERLIIGHESLGRIIEAPRDSGFAAGDLVAGIVRRPDPVPCAHCAIGEWDLCSNGRYTERGIKERDGYAADIVRLEPEFAVRVDAALGIAGVLTEPASVVAKAWSEIECFASRSRATVKRSVLVTGAGPIGLLAAMMGVQRGLVVTIYDRAEGGLKPALTRDLGADYRSPSVRPLDNDTFDVILECTGASPVIMDMVNRLRPDGILCLTGVSSGGHTIDIDLGGLNREMVLENTLVFGSVNARRAHYDAGAAALARADRAWLERLISRRVRLEDWQRAFERESEDVKVVLEFAD